MRQGLAQSIAQRQGNRRMQRLMAIVQRKKVAVQRQKTKPVITTPVAKEAKKLEEWRGAIDHQRCACDDYAQQGEQSGKVGWSC